MMEGMVRTTGIPLRSTHQIVGVLARVEGAIRLQQIDAVADKVLGIKLSNKGLTEEMVSEALDPISNIKKRNIIGGPAFEEMEKTIIRRKETLKHAKEEISALRNGSETSLNKLIELVKQYISKT
jgi:argininosuccinate lyase